jgi:hypothetical protein
MFSLQLFYQENIKSETKIIEMPADLFMKRNKTLKATIF